jgi:hypothetical protein
MSSGSWLWAITAGLLPVAVARGLHVLAHGRKCRNCGVRVPHRQRIEHRKWCES